MSSTRGQSTSPSASLQNLNDSGLGVLSLYSSPRRFKKSALSLTPSHTDKCNKKMKNRGWKEELIDTKQTDMFDHYKVAIVATIAHKTMNSDMSDVIQKLNVDMWAILSSKAEEGAEEKLESCNQGEGLWGYLRIPVVH